MSRGVVPDFARYETAIVTSAAALAVCFALQLVPGALPSAPFYLALYIAAVATTVDGGLRPGLVSIALTTAGAIVLWVGGLRIGGSQVAPIIDLLVFIALSVVSAVVIAQQRSIQRRVMTRAATNAQLYNRMAGLLEDHEQAEAALRESAASLERSEQRLRSLVQGAPIILAEYDNNERLTSINGRGIEWLQEDSLRQLGKTLNEIFAGDPERLETIRRAYAGDIVTTTVGSPSTVMFETRWAPRRAANGTIEGVVAISTNLTERARLVDALREAEARLRFVLDAGRIGAWGWESSTGRFAFSETMEAIHGIEPGSFDGTTASFLRLVAPEDRLAVRTVLDRVDTEDVTIDYWAQWPTGERRRISLSTRATFDGESLVRMAGVALDATDRWEATEQLVQDQQDRARIEGMALVAAEAVHLFTNDITPAVGVLELVRDEVNLPAEAKAEIDAAITKLRLAAEATRTFQQAARTPAGVGA